MASPAPLRRPDEPASIVILGAVGDLARRKLYPALASLCASGLLPEKFGIVGVARRPLDLAAYREEVGASMRRVCERGVAERAWADLRDRLRYVAGDLRDGRTYADLAARLAELSPTGRPGNVLFYLATPPSEFGPAVRALGEAGLAREDAGWRRVVIEKPFGRDTASARVLDAELRAVLSEGQIFRIDHYLGKETVQNLLVLRFANGLFEPVWNRRYVDHVQITVAEELGVEGRGRFYETAGALRDVVQNHLFQLLTLVAMEPPSNLAAEPVRNEKVKVLEAIRPMGPEDVRRNAVRGQYGEGVSGGKPVPAYRAERDVDPRSRVETFAAVRLDIDNWRWAGVPFYLRSGKRLARRETEIVIQFRRPPLQLFHPEGVAGIPPNALHLHVQPDEALSLEIQAKAPGAAIRLRPVRLSFDYGSLGSPCEATGYERLLHDVLQGDATLFHRADMVDAAWRIATPILEAWEASGDEVPVYPAGSWGPAAAGALLARDGRAWADT